MRFSSVIIGFLLISRFIPVNGQEKSNFFFTGAQAHYGFIIPHTSKVEPISHTNPYGFELDLNWLHTSFESWRVFHAYNISGVQLVYYNYQNPEIVGSSYALTAYTEPIVKRGNRLMFSVRGGGGLSYQTNIFDFDKNTENLFFSTRISFPLYMSARLKFGITDNLFLTLAGTYNHISNGAMRIPNMGMNFPTASAGLELFPGKFPKLDNGYVPEKSIGFREQYILIQGITGYKDVYGVSTWTWGMSSRYTWRMKSFYALNAGAELIFDKGVRKMIEIEDKKLDYKRFALTGGQDFFLGRIIFSQYIGVYLYSPYKAKAPVYQKYEVSYRVMPHLLTGVYLKAHTSDAELFGFSMNCILGIK
ncbi:MAG TPA: acyloxyacyl hydrolase [Bacteroidales bacterium]|nr:acyloxyacyl hydrolase [Bacteroidales bacterium]